ncbi:PREDICTED: T-cell activation Rho GTPase-activating protein-like [Haliaeetus leucocephalus]|uniref:T-cell activation Rho GTPase-activating protein-like n=1 Tax=Haliaeetus leucocephalus TaxID=52644 RepID=UPI00053CB537|nr:PREDICTED: T-cell activation Rho GTPase-activating protein-like [Haliaeetus leucocephalus]
MGLPWPFARRGTSAAAEVPGPSASGGGGALFGRPLAALCSQDGTLPQPIQDLLALLHEHGPSTEGIFRLAASERASRELREALDSGAEVRLESQPAHLLAVVLKDFLRKIPSKLLEAELYEEWMSALQKSSRQEKLAGLKEVAGKLPEANLLLLKQLLALLQNISRNVATSRMTAGNLAICVGPNLLSPPEEHTLPLDALVQVTGKVRCVYQPATAFRTHPSFAVQRWKAMVCCVQVTRLVEFLIEHHGELFEEEEEEAAGLAGASAEESPAPGAEAGTAEVPIYVSCLDSPDELCYLAFEGHDAAPAPPRRRRGESHRALLLWPADFTRTPPSRSGPALPADPSHPSQEALLARSSAP